MLALGAAGAEENEDSGAFLKFALPPSASYPQAVKIIQFHARPIVSA